MTFNIQELGHIVAKEAMGQIEINGMSFENFLVQVDKLVGFLQSEIEIHEDKLKDEMNYPNKNYDGENVGSHKVARRLSEKHINFCKRMLSILTDKDTN